MFDPDKGFVKRLIQFTPSTGLLDSPWGLARVPDEFGKFGHNVLLVGNFGNGEVNAFDIHTGTFRGTLLHRPGQPLEFDDLWALFFFNNHLYFTAGIVDETYGLFGVIRPAGKDEDSHD